MISKKRNIEELNKKCLLIERLGFEIEHEDSRVSFDGHIFDFSATACDEAAIVQTALKTMLQIGIAEGKQDIISGVKKLFNIESDSN